MQLLIFMNASLHFIHLPVRLLNTGVTTVSLIKLSILTKVKNKLQFFCHISTVNGFCVIITEVLH